MSGAAPTVSNSKNVELASLWSLAVLVIIGSIYVAVIAGRTKADSETFGIVIGGLMAALPMLINSIRNIGQAQVIQNMTEQLSKSAPIVPANDTGLETGNEKPLEHVDEINIDAENVTVKPKGNAA